MHIKCGMGSINRHAPSRTVPKTWKTVHSDLPFKMVKITELKVCALQTRPYRLYVKHRLLTAEWTKSISCRWERPISYLIRRMLIDISLSWYLHYSLCGWTSSGSWRPGQTGWRAWTCTPLSRGWWSASTAALWWCGTTSHRSLSARSTFL